MKALVTILALFFSLNTSAVEIQIPVVYVLGQGDAVESQALVKLLNSYGAEGYNEGQGGLQYRVTGSIWKQVVDCPERKVIYNVSLQEYRQVGMDRERGAMMDFKDLNTIEDRSCALNTPPDKVRHQLNKWGLSQIKENTGSTAFVINCAGDKKCGIKFQEGASFNHANVRFGEGGYRGRE